MANKLVMPSSAIKKFPRVDPWAIVLTLAILAGTYTVYRQKHKIEERGQSTERKSSGVSVPGIH